MDPRASSVAWQNPCCILGTQARIVPIERAFPLAQPRPLSTIRVSRAVAKVFDVWPNTSTLSEDDCVTGCDDISRCQPTVDLRRWVN